MAKIEVFFEYGKILGAFQKLRPPLFVVLLRDEAGNLEPIYEGNNDVHPGRYDIYIYQPYKTNGEKTEKSGWVTVFSEEDVIYIVVVSIVGTLTAFAHKEDNWGRYISGKDPERIQRYIGWYADQAHRMLSD